MQPTCCCNRSDRRCNRSDRRLQEWALYAYRVLLPIAAGLDLYAVVSLVLNRYLAARAYKDRGRRAHAEFIKSTAETRRQSVW